MAKCQTCGTEASGKFCPNCGSQVLQAPPVAAAALPAQQPPPQQYPPQQPYPPGYAPMPPQAKSSPWKWVAIIGGSVLGLLVVAVALLLALGDDVTVSTIPNPPVIASKIAEDSAPLDNLTTVPAQTDPIYAAVQVEVQKGDILAAKWYYRGNHQAHLDYELPAEGEFIGWASFEIGNGGDPWPAGLYKLELYLNGEKAQEKIFQVK